MAHKVHIRVFGCCMLLFLPRSQKAEDSEDAQIPEVGRGVRGATHAVAASARVRGHADRGRARAADRERAADVRARVVRRVLARGDCAVGDGGRRLPRGVQGARHPSARG